MSKEDLTLVACVLDRSGSMQSIIKDAVGGFNAFLKAQKEDANGECRMTVAMFNDDYEILHNNVDVNVVEEFTETSYCPSGCTALLDAVGRTINEVGKTLDEMKEEEKPSKVIFLILTDGLENRSREFKLSDIQDKIKEQRETWNWEFVYLAADDQGFAAGQTMGVVHSSKFDVNNTRGAYLCAAKCVSDYRATGKTNIDKDIS